MSDMRTVVIECVRGDSRVTWEEEHPKIEADRLSWRFAFKESLEKKMPGWDAIFYGLKDKV